MHNAAHTSQKGDNQGPEKKQQQMCNKLNLKQIPTEKNKGLAEQCWNRKRFQWTFSNLKFVVQGRG